MKKLLILVTLTLGVSDISFGQDKAKDLKKLFDLMQTEKMIDAMMNNMIPVLKQQAGEQIQGDDSQEKYNKYIDFMMDETKELTRRLVDEEMIQIYGQHFTGAEIKDLIKFYESSTGKKLLEKTPEITKGLMNAMMTKYMPEFQERLTKRLEELK